MKTFLFLSYFLLFGLIGYSQNSESSVFINLMEAEFEAFKDKDPSLWIIYVDDNAVFTGADNTIKSKDDIIKEMKNAPAIFSTASEKYEEVVTRTFDKTSVLSCLTTFSFTSADGQISSVKFKFTRVHIFDGKNWKLIYHSAVPI